MALPQLALRPRKTRVVWKHHEREWLARRATRELVAAGFDFANEDDDSLGEALMEPLRKLVGMMSEDRQRPVPGPSKFPWLVAMARDMVRAHEGLPSPYPQDILADRSVRPVPALAEEPEEGPAPVIPPGYALVPEAEWREVRAEMERLRKGQGKVLRLLLHLADGLSDQFNAVSDLVLDAVPHITPPPVVPATPPPAASPHPLIVLAGARERDREHVKRKVGDLAEIVFVDQNRTSPTKIGRCDRVVALRFCGGQWLRKAREAHQGHLSEVSSVSQAVKEIERLCGVC